MADVNTYYYLFSTEAQTVAAFSGLIGAAAMYRMQTSDRGVFVFKEVKYLANLKSKGWERLSF